MNIFRIELYQNQTYPLNKTVKPQNTATKFLHLNRPKNDCFIKSNVAFKGQLTKVQPVLNQLKINPYDMLKTQDTAQALEDYMRNGMFIHVTPKGGKKFGDLFWEQFTNAKSNYTAQTNPDDIYTDLRKIAERLASPEELDKAATKQVEKRASALGVMVKNIFEELGIKFTPHSSFLDIGCGNGEVAKEIAKNLGIEKTKVRGLEIIERDDFCNINRYQFDGQNIPASFQKSNLSTLFNVLHHTRNDQEAKSLLKSIYKHLDKDGILLLRDHNASTDTSIKYWQVRHLLPIKVSKVDPPCLVQDTVYHSCNEWSDICSDIGFKPKFIKKDKSFGDIYSFYLGVKK